MTIDAAQLRTAIRTLHPGALSPADAETITALAQMSVDADGQEDAEEIRLFFAIGKAVFELAGLAETPTPTFADDEDDDHVRVQTLAAALGSTSSRELAYAVCHLLSIIDVEIAPAETDFLEGLRAALQIGEDRADELASQLGAAITPLE